MEENVIEWINQFEGLSNIATVEPQAAGYCAFVGGFKHKDAYTIRIVPNIRKHLEKLDQAVNQKLFRPLLMVISAMKWKGSYYYFR